MGLDTEYIIETLKQEVPELEAIYLFGSQNSGNTTPDSDIDLAFLTYNSVDNVHRFDIQEKIASKFGRDVDLIDLNSASTVMQHQVIYNGKLLYSRTRNSAEEFEMRVAGLYIDLCDLREPIIENIKESGSIYK